LVTFAAKSNKNDMQSCKEKEEAINDAFIGVTLSDDKSRSLSLRSKLRKVYL
jgi:hypothetical protein